MTGVNLKSAGVNMLIGAEKLGNAISNNKGKIAIGVVSAVALGVLIALGVEHGIFSEMGKGIDSAFSKEGMNRLGDALGKGFTAIGNGIADGVTGTPSFVATNEIAQYALMGVGGGVALAGAGLYVEKRQKDAEAKAGEPQELARELPFHSEEDLGGDSIHDQKLKTKEFKHELFEAAAKKQDDVEKKKIKPEWLTKEIDRREQEEVKLKREEGKKVEKEKEEVLEAKNAKERSKMSYAQRIASDVFNFLSSTIVLSDEKAEDV